MSTVTRSAPAASGVSFQTLCLASIAAGLIGAAVGLLMAAIPTDVDEDRYSYPLRAAPFVALQLFFAVHHLGLVAGAVALHRYMGRTFGGAARIGTQTAIVGLALLTVTEVLAAFAADFNYSGAYTTTLDTIYGLTSSLAGVGFIVAGIKLVRTPHWSTRWALVPLATGIFVFVPMFPMMMAGYTAARLAIGGWMLMFALLGWALLQAPQNVATPTR